MRTTNRLIRNLRRRRQKGMTLLEIMIVLAILALVMGLLVGPRVLRMFQGSKVDIAKTATKQYAFDAYTQWSQAHPSKACPDKIEELSEFMNEKKSVDPWGSPYKMLCGPNAPAGVKPIGVMSFGEDQKEGTEDDVKSWD